MEPETFTSATEVVPNLTIMVFDTYSSSPLLGVTTETWQGIMIRTYSSTIWGSTTETYQGVISRTYYLPFLGSNSVTYQIEEVLNQLHQDWIKIPKPAGVRDYLLRYPDLTDILLFVCKVARERVGMYPELSLEVYHDPEIEDEYLTLYVRKQDYDENILDKIEDIRKQYEQNLIGRSGWLLVTTDFHPPRY